MIVLNLKNIENIIFADNEVRTLLSDFRHIFDQWLLSKRVPYLRSIRLQAMMDLLNNITNEHILKLEEYFEDNILIDKLDYHIVENTILPISSDLSKFASFGNFAVDRDSNNLYITFWR